MTMEMTCATVRGLLPALALGELEGEPAGVVAAHLAGCAGCAAEATAMRAADRLVGQATAAPAAGGPLPRGRRALPGAVVATWGTIASPLGDLHVAVSVAGVVAIGFGWQEAGAVFAARLAERGYAPVADPAAVAAVGAQLRRYLAGETRGFEAAIDWTGATPFARAVLEATARVPYGSVATYRDVAVAAGKPGALRAVGNALHRNPVPVIVPCHRIVRSDATLGGYAGGLEAKRMLLALEGAIPATPTLFP